MKKFYISTAIAYTSSKPHLGNTYDCVCADVIARFKRLEGYDVYFQTGTDEHGQKIQNKAIANNKTPQQYVDDVADLVKSNWDVLNISYDRFVRTTDKNHKDVVSNIFEKMFKNGDIYKGTYSGLYCEPCEAFFTEKELLDGKCPDCGRDVRKTEEEAYFFKMSKYSSWLSEYLNNHPDFIKPENKKDEIINNFIKPGLQDLCVSRSSFTWGVPVNFDKKHVVYVWLDALNNYITFLGYNPNGESSSDFNKYWPADVHVVGKDIVRFHAIYWPIFLKSLGIEMPKTIFAHPWLLFNDDKMSKSKGNIVYADDLVEKYGTDAVRHYLISEIGYTSDGNYTDSKFVETYNNDLANTLGNLVSRTFGMIDKYLSGNLCQVSDGYNELDNSLINNAQNLYSEVKNRLDEYKIKESESLIFDFLRKCNKYIDDNLPWQLFKDNDIQRLQMVLYNLIESIRISAILLQPYLPETSQTILSYLKVESKTLEDIKKFGGFVPNVKYGTIEPLFVRINK